MNMRKIVVILDNIRSRENVGSIFRTADAVGVAKIYLCGITPIPKLDNSELRISDSKINSQFAIHNKIIDKISKTALGAEKWVPWEYHKQTWRLIEKLKKDGYQIIALEKTKTAKNLFEVEAQNGPVALMVGNEVLGLSPEILKRSSRVVSIPMNGQKESLNVAVAFGIAVYHFSTIIER